jgi:hypothetical protein
MNDDLRNPMEGAGIPIARLLLSVPTATLSLAGQMWLANVRHSKKPD